jgi:hypothetical protein
LAVESRERLSSSSLIITISNLGLAIDWGYFSFICGGAIADRERCFFVFIMFYQAPEIQGSIRNLRQYYRGSMRQDVWAYEIYIDDVLVKSEDCHWWSNTREEVITEVKEIGDSEALLQAVRIKEQELIKRELATVGNRIYVKWCTDITRAGKAQGITGYYGIFEKRHLYCCATYQSLDAVLSVNLAIAHNLPVIQFNPRTLEIVVIEPKQLSLF